MGKKAKIGKQRRDKFYFLAKEAGFRSRAAFKLVQLNKRFEFLQQSRALVDLCAAPGGWLQVAEQQMPVSSLRIGVDLVPIKPIKNCLTLQGDITEEKTRQAVRKELGTWEADCVLHDGAPNVGANWAHDAFLQNCLTLSALRMATQILRRGGYFVTKVFRSADSQTLIGVFEKLFKKVHVWKPAASRLESAEIFVVCERYLKPDKIDSVSLDSRKVFSMQPSDETESDTVNLHRRLLHPGRKVKKAKALGYESGILVPHQEISASEFLTSKNALQLLNRASALVLDSERVMNSEHTTPEIRESMRDIKVCGPAELRSLLQWRKKLLYVQKKEEALCAKSANLEDISTVAQMEAEEASAELKELEENAMLIRTLKTDEKAKFKKRKKLLLREKRKLEERKKLQMVHEGDNLAYTEEDLELFSLRTMRKLASRARAMHAAEQVKMEDRDDYRYGHDDEDESQSDFERDETDLSCKRAIRTGIDKYTLKFEKSETEMHDDDVDEAGTDDDRLTNIVNEEDKYEFEADQNDFKNKRKLSPELLAMGEQLIYSKKRARDFEECAWNRYTNNDEGLPDWFVADEKRHCLQSLPVDKERVLFYAQRDRALNARSIKKVVEAKLRKRQRRQRRMERAKKRAEGIVESEQMEHGEKVRELRKLYKKAGAKEKKQVKYQVITKGKRGSIARPKGPFKLVDKRLKKDNRGQQRRAGIGGTKRRTRHQQKRAKVEKGGGREGKKRRK